MTDLDVPDGMALTCKPCGWRPGIDLPMGLIAAHFETEHGTDKVNLELVVLCSRCDQPMAFSHTLRRLDHFQCEPCRRVRTIRRNA